MRDLNAWQIEFHPNHAMRAVVTRVAIPIFKMKVSPVFDSCTRVLLVDIENNREVDRKEIYLDALSLTERVTILLKTGVSAVICGGISDVMEKILTGTEIDLITSITGEIEDVLQAYLNRGLDHSRFHMPGFREE